MSNEILSLQEIANLALENMTDHLMFPMLCTKDFQDEPASLGDLVDIKYPIYLEANEFVNGTEVLFQDFPDSTIKVSLDHLITVDVNVPETLNSISIDELNERLIKPASKAIADKINTNCLTDAYSNVASVAGNKICTAGTLDEVANVRMQLNKQNAPTADRVLIVSHAMDQNLCQLDCFMNSKQEGENSALLNASIGKVMNISGYVSNDIPVHTTGTVISAGSALMVSATVKQGDAYIPITGGGSYNFKAGDIIIINSTNYAVAQDVSFVSGDADVYIVGGAKRNHSAGATVNYVGGRDTPTYDANIAFHPTAFTYVTRPLANIDGSYVINDKGLSLRVTKVYDQILKCTKYSFDVLYGFVAVAPDRATRLVASLS